MVHLAMVEDLVMEVDLAMVEDLAMEFLLLQETYCLEEYQME